MAVFVPGSTVAGLATSYISRLSDLLPQLCGDDLRA
jgi:hypothetical protein